MKKKCPKCGEDNPPEAVMCWACYTPLSGESAASGGVSKKQPLAAATAGDEEKKKMPPWQLAVVGVALLGGLFLGVRTMMSSPEEEGEGTPPTESAPSPGMPAPPPPPPPSPGMPAPPPPSPAPPSPPPAAGIPAPSPQRSPYSVMVAPSPRLSIATMGIVPNDGTATGVQAASLASYARRQIKPRITKRWSTLYIYVFADQESAEYFSRYMKKRKGRALTNDDFTHLQALWSSVLARYTYTTYKGKRVERILYPSKNPGGWWNEKAS